MTQTVNPPRSPRAPQTIGLLLAVLSLSLSVGCSNAHPASPDDGTVSATLSIQAEDFFPSAPDTNPQGRRSALSTTHAQAFSFSDVKSIRVDIKDKDSGAALFVNAPLNQYDPPSSPWATTFTSLPKGKNLTFTAHAYDGSSPPVLLFQGSTDQSFTQDNQSISIALAPSTDKQQIALPRIVRISIPSTFSAGQANNISFAVEGSTGETLSYALTAPDSGGNFYPPTGSLTLSAIAGTFVTQYLPPSVTSDTVFEHTVRVTNSAGNSVTTTFKTTVKPPGHTDSVGGTGVTVLFNPVIQALDGSRVGSSGDVVFTAKVVDDSSESKLTYSWAFAPTSGTYTTAPTMDGSTTKTGTLHGYTPSLQGLLTVTVKDSDLGGGTTTLYYSLIPNEFPDNPYVEGDPSVGINSIRAGIGHTCVLFNNGTIECWGQAVAGQLGNNSTTPVADAPGSLPYNAGPVTITGKATKLAVGSNHSCALLDSGYVSCWGVDTYGQLGYNMTYNVGGTSKVSDYGYVSLGGNATKVAAGGNHSCALMDTGKVRCWGYNAYGQLGYGNTNNIGDGKQTIVADVQVVPSGTTATVSDIVAGDNHTCALLSNGTVRCWGLNTWGQLGTNDSTNYGTTQVASAAPLVNLGGASVIQLSAGYNHTCALLSNGTLRCWGYNNWGQLGYGDMTNLYTPKGAEVSVGGRVLQVAAGANYTCALLESGNIKCWGYNGNGELGLGAIGSPTYLPTPSSTPVNLNGSTAFQIATGANHTCALLSTGKARCWGNNSTGQLGYGNKTSIASPTAVGDLQLLAP